MGEQVRKHSVAIDGSSKILISGVVSVNSLCDKEVDLALADCRLVIKGGGLNANKLSVDEGTIAIDCESIVSLSYVAKRGKMSLSKIFK